MVVATDIQRQNYNLQLSNKLHSDFDIPNLILVKAFGCSKKLLLLTEADCIFFRNENKTIAATKIRLWYKFEYGLFFVLGR